MFTHVRRSCAVWPGDTSRKMISIEAKEKERAWRERGRAREGEMSEYKAEKMVNARTHFGFTEQAQTSGILVSFRLYTLLERNLMVQVYLQTDDECIRTSVNFT